MSKELYRDNVCAVIGPSAGDCVLICHRIGAVENEGWQFPQGGIDPKADLISEMKRELLEEIGNDRVAVIKIASGLYRYEYPEGASVNKRGYIGQQQRWVYARFIDAEPQIRFDATDHHPEFDSWRWASPAEAMKLIVDFKRKVYKEALYDLDLI